MLDIVAFWWSARFGDVPDATAAQLYHFDMDRVKWIKFFFYLTDVTPGSGPHCFVAGSHRRFAQPRELLRHGYARIGDDEVARHYPRDRMLELTGPRGSIFAVDTRGFHKGKPPQTADRLLLQLEFSDCLFGAEYDRTPWPLPAGAAARDAVTRFPRVYAKFPLAEPRAAEKAA